MQVHDMQGGIKFVFGKYYAAAERAPSTHLMGTSAVAATTTCLPKLNAIAIIHLSHSELLAILGTCGVRRIAVIVPSNLNRYSPQKNKNK